MKFARCKVTGDVDFENVSDEGIRVPQAGGLFVLALAPLGARLLKKKCKVSARGRSCACLGSRSPLACGHFQMASNTQIFDDVIV